jgi:hypothetical protein
MESCVLIDEQGEVTQEAVTFLGSVHVPIAIIGSVGFNSTRLLKDIAGECVETKKGAVAHYLTLNKSQPVLVLDVNIDVTDQLDPKLFCLLVTVEFGLLL